MSSTEHDTASALLGELREAALPLRGPEGSELEEWVGRIARGKVVLLGESTHGTSEFYRLRHFITRRLVEDYGFRLVAAEADWPDIAHLNAYASGQGDSAPHAMLFKRFPRWMWRNTEFLSFLRWLRTHNQAHQGQESVSIHGLDLYSMQESIHEVLNFLHGRDPELESLARQRYACILPFISEPEQYGHAVLLRRQRSCEGEVAAMLADLLRRRIDQAAADGQISFDVEQNARIIRNAERYYRAIFRGSTESWNVRDQHMFDTLMELLESGGRDSRVVIWAHNSHVGDASATELAQHGEFNLGQLVREQFGEAAHLVGLFTGEGTVVAAHDWGGEHAVRDLQEPLEGSYESLFTQTGIPGFLLDLRQVSESLRQGLAGERLERAVGVIYRPETERTSHYFRARLSEQFDSCIWLQRTSALEPLDDKEPKAVEEPAHPMSRRDK